MNAWTIVHIVFGSLYGLGCISMLVMLSVPLKNRRTGKKEIGLLDRATGASVVEHVMGMIMLILLAPFVWVAIGVYMLRHRKDKEQKLQMAEERTAHE